MKKKQEWEVRPEIIEALAEYMEANCVGKKNAQKKIQVAAGVVDICVKRHGIMQPWGTLVDERSLRSARIALMNPKRPVPVPIGEGNAGLWVTDSVQDCEDVYGMERTRGLSILQHARWLRTANHTRLNILKLKHKAQAGELFASVA